MDIQSKTVRLPRELYERLRQAAFDRRVPQNTLIERGVQLVLHLGAAYGDFILRQMYTDAMEYRNGSQRGAERLHCPDCKTGEPCAEHADDQPLAGQYARLMRKLTGDDEVIPEGGYPPDRDEGSH